MWAYFLTNVPFIYRLGAQQSFFTKLTRLLGMRLVFPRESNLGWHPTKTHESIGKDLTP